MASRSYKQFVRWFVDTQSDEEIFEALKATKAPKELLTGDLSTLVKVKGRKSRLSTKSADDSRTPDGMSLSELRADILGKEWIHKNLAIPLHFEDRFASVKADVNELTVDETESSVHSMSEKHGAPAVVFCLVVNPDEMKQAIGYRLIDELGDSLKAERGEAPPVLAEEGVDIYVDPDPNPVIEAVEAATLEISAAEAMLDDESIDAVVERFLAAISDYKARRSESGIKLEQALLQLCADYSDAAQFLLDGTEYAGSLAAIVPSRAREIAASAVREADTYVEKATELLREAEEIRTAPPPSVARQMEAANRARELQSMAIDTVRALLRVLGVSVDAVAVEPEGEPVTEEPEIEHHPPPKRPTRKRRLARPAVRAAEKPCPAPEPEPPVQAEPAVEAQSIDAPQAKAEPDTSVQSPTATENDEPAPGAVPAGEATPGMRQLIRDAVAESDYALAYWLALGSEASGEGAPVPSWLHYANFLAAELRFLSPDAMRALDQVCNLHPAPYRELCSGHGQGSRAAATYILGASVGPALLGNEYGPSNWLRDVSSNALGIPEELTQIIDGVLTLQNEGVSCLDFTGDRLLGSQDWDLAAKEASGRVGSWQRTADRGKLGYQPATLTRRFLACSKESVLRDAIDAVVADDRGSADLVHRARSSYLDSKESRQKLIRETARTAVGPRPRPVKIEGHNLDSLTRDLARLNDDIACWVDAVRRCDARPRRGSMSDAQCQALVNRIANQAATIVANGVFDNPYSEALRASLAQIADVLQGRAELPAARRHWRREIVGPVILSGSFSPFETAQWIESESVDPPDAALGSVCPERVASGSSAMESEFERVLGEQDYARAKVIIQVSGDGPDAQSLMQARLGESKQALAQRLTQVYKLMEEAAQKHLITSSDRSQLDGEFLSMEHSLESGEILQYGPAYAKLDELEKRVDRLKEERVDALSREIDELGKRIDAHRADLSDAVVRHAESSLGKARTYIDSFGDDKSLVVAESFYSLALNAVELGAIAEGPDNLAQVDSDGVDHVTAFLSINKSVERDLAKRRSKPMDLVTRIQKNRAVGGIDMSKIPAPRAQEAAEGIAAYYRLMAGSASDAHEGWYAQNVTTLLRYIGFQQPSVSLVAIDSNAVHLRATMTARDISPLPEFGSAHGGLYDVIVVHGKPRVTELNHILNVLGVENSRPVVIYLGRMPQLLRHEWSTSCRERRRTVMLIDEILLHYMLSIRENRLEAAVSCGVAWGWACPYSDGATAPREMFAGRQLMISKIGEPRGAFVVYGGRQFGKSSLLRMVEDQYHRPESREYVVFCDIKSIGDIDSARGTQDTSMIWTRAWEEMRESDLNWMCRDDPRQTAQDVQAALRKELKHNPGMRIILLFDEADHFLKHEASLGFPELNAVKALMEETGYRFKAVFTGLHNVQRYYTKSNHPLAQLSAPIVVGPLEPAEAKQLVEGPMRALGIGFESDYVVSQILSYTNFHASLIQFFCNKLVAVVRAKKDEPPYIVTGDDVDQVYKDPAFRERMGDRFRVTVLMDTRYQVIVYSMIMEQLNDRDGYKRTFEANEIARLAKDWWPQGFEDMGLFEIRPLLDELVGLGVLIRCEDGQFRIRSANIVRALGKPDDIEDELLQIAESPGPSKDRSQSLRVRVHDSPPQWGPITLAQAADAIQPQPGLCLVFGSEAMNLSSTAEALRVYAGDSVNLSVLQQRFTSAAGVANHLSSLAARSLKGRHVVVLDPSTVHSKSDDLMQILIAAGRRAVELSTENRLVRAVILMNPADALELARLRSKGDLGLERYIDTEIALRKWDHTMVENFLSHSESVSTVPAVNGVLHVTGGWPFLIRRVQEQSSGSTLPTVEQLTFDLLEDVDGIRTGFLQACGFGLLDGAIDIVRMLTGAEAALSDDELVQLVELETQHDAQECRALVDVLFRVGLLVDNGRGELCCDDVVARVVRAR